MEGFVNRSSSVLRHSSLTFALLLIAVPGWAGDSDRKNGPSADQRSRLRDFAAVKHLAVDANGTPTTITGQLGYVGFGPVERTVHDYIATTLQPLYRGTGEERFRTLRVTRDKRKGLAHVRVEQAHRGIPIVGAEMIVHVREKTGEVTGVNGKFMSMNGMPVKARLGSALAMKIALGEAGFAAPQMIDAPSLTYVLDENGTPHLTWSATIVYRDEQGPQRDRLFADAGDGHLVARHPQIWRSLFRKIYDANNGTSLPGTFLFQEGGSSLDNDAQDAYDYSGDAWDYYSARHGRDSWNDSGGNLISSVHYDVNENNAFWDNNQMVFGDGDGSQFSPLSGALDIVAHEMTHGVTQDSANLTYWSESGALNESMSDIFGAATEAYVRGQSSATWKIGEDAYTPGTNNDALRYMNDPSDDGTSRDYYPDRYTGGLDNGGVHWNSGISNLAFYLLSEGGTHPQGKTAISVPSIGRIAAEHIFYEALTANMTSSTNFAGARDATLQAALDIYGPCSSEAAAVPQAWNAVGVVVPSSPADIEPNDSIPTANPLQTWSNYIVGYLCSSGNADWFSIQKQYTYNTLYISMTPPANRDYDLELWQGSPYATSTNTGNGVAETITWSSGSGMFYIKVVGKSSAFSTSAPYTLSVSQ